MSDHKEVTITDAPTEDLSIYKKKHEIKQQKRKNNSVSIVNEKVQIKKIQGPSISSINYGRYFSEESHARTMNYLEDSIEKTAQFKIKYSTPKNVIPKHEARGNSYQKKINHLVDNDINSSNIAENKKKKKRAKTLLTKINGSKILLLRADMILPKKAPNKNSFLEKQKSRYQYPLEDLFDDISISTPVKSELNSWTIPKAANNKDKFELGAGITDSSINYQSISKTIEYKDKQSPKKIEYSHTRPKRSRIYNNGERKEYTSNTISVIKEETINLQNSTNLSLIHFKNKPTLNQSYNNNKDTPKKDEPIHGNDENKSTIMKLPPMKTLDRPKITIPKIDHSNVMIKEIFPNINPSTYPSDSKSQLINFEILTPNIKNFAESPLRIINKKIIDGKRTPNSDKLSPIDLKSKEKQVFEKNFEKAQKKIQIIESEKESKKKFDDLMVFKY